MSSAATGGVLKLEPFFDRCCTLQWSDGWTWLCATQKVKKEYENLGKILASDCKLQQATWRASVRRNAPAAPENSVGLLAKTAARKLLREPAHP